MANPQSSSVELEDIRHDLHLAIYNRGDPKRSFITYERLQAVWAGNRLARFLRDPRRDPDRGIDNAFSNSQIETAQNSLLRMISILIMIDWNEWKRFKRIFFLHDTATTTRRDNNIHNLDYDELRDESFLRDTCFPERFLMQKWTYIPITFDGHTKEPYEEDRRLPLVLQGTVVQTRWSEVTKAIIPPNQITLKHLSDHLGLPIQTNASDLMVARKRILNGDRELQRLKSLQSSLSSHKRIIYPLALVTLHHELNIIMPWADMNLETFLTEGYKSMPATDCLLKDLVKESRDLAAAFDFLHHGLQAECGWRELQHIALYHADIKPENILVFRTEGSSTGFWRLTDFGVSHEARSSISQQNGETASLPATTQERPPPQGGQYQAPDKHAHEKSDIWSFGCILVRLFALGLDHQPPTEAGGFTDTPVNSISVEGRFYEGTTSTLNETVRNWIQDLPSRNEARWNRRILEKMRKLLLAMLETDLESRCNASHVRRDLHELFMMLNESAPVSSRYGVGVLVSSIMRGTVHEVEHSLQLRPDVEENWEGERPLIHAVNKGNALILSALLTHKRDLDLITPSSAGVTPLHLAVAKGNADVVTVLIDNLIRRGFKSSLNAVSQAGRTPLMEAAFCGHAAVVSALLARGADHKIRVRGLNCLHYAVRNIESDVGLLTAFRGKIRDCDEPPDKIKGYETPTMLHITLGIHAAGYKSPEGSALWKEKLIVLSRESDVNRPYKRETPIQLAMKMDNEFVVNALLREGQADIPDDPKGLTPQMKALVGRIRRERTRRDHR